MTLNDPSVNRVLFHPRAEPVGYRPLGQPTETRSGEAVLCGYLHDHPAADTLLLFFHGNGEIAADYDALAPVFTAAGAAFWVVDYRGYGRSTGEPGCLDTLRDAEAVLEDVAGLSRRLGRVFRRVVVMGRSLGSASAIHRAGHNDLLAVGFRSYVEALQGFLERVLRG